MMLVFVSYEDLNESYRNSACPRMSGRCATSAQSKIEGECSGTVSFYSAEALCDSQGARLCSADELMADESHGSGCNYDFEWVWSSTPCDLDCVVGSSSSGSEAGVGRQAVLGFSGSAPANANQPKCLDPANSKETVVRCCADACTPGEDEFVKPAPRATDKDTDEACNAEKTGRCKCDQGFDANTCQGLGSAVGQQLAGSTSCHVVNCGHGGLTELPKFPANAIFAGQAKCAWCCWSPSRCC